MHMKNAEVEHKIVMPGSRFSRIRKNYLKSWQLYTFLLPALIFFIVLSKEADAMIEDWG
ncbi:hypothetical protein [Bacillus sp. SD088]|uniref:hypothetical protein n=1 Tax=Bacillus sp. SD088 TaxID=2782012 RepID=UPI001A967119|nr:hypothetical protein [Bacillus sp. SD088]MBO0991868.1 hypothetical protein [Bacillus sp. SD088]